MLTIRSRGHAAIARRALSGATVAVALSACTAEPLAPLTPPPQGAAGSPTGCRADQMADDALVGKPEAEAIALLEGCPWRIGQRDAHQYPGTMDFIQERRTLGVAGGVVVWVRRG